MNAMTASDFTCYPFSTMNRVDYKNLLDVYLDAAFFPKIAAEDFSQEGHRFEFAKMDDPTSDLIYKGIVFNEMKGAMGSQSARYGRALGENLFPTSTYHWNSGGDPVNIPDLTYEQLKAFHALHYHPSNAKFYTYGDLPLEETLQQIEDSALHRFDKLDVSKLIVEDEKRFTAPKRVEATVPADAVVADANKQSLISLAWLMVNQIEDPVSLDNFALGVASDLLTSGPQSYLYEALLEPGLGSGFAPGTGYGGSRRETSFAVGLKDVADADMDKIEKTILDVLERISRRVPARARRSGDAPARTRLRGGYDAVRIVHRFRSLLDVGARRRLAARVAHARARGQAQRRARRGSAVLAKAHQKVVLRQHAPSHDHRAH
jgi:Zn-dependent M16 (insulinase) family peptidase